MILRHVVHERRPVGLRCLPDGAKPRLLQADSRRGEDGKKKKKKNEEEGEEEK